MISRIGRAVSHAWPEQDMARVCLYLHMSNQISVDNIEKFLDAVELQLCSSSGKSNSIVGSSIADKVRHIR